MLWCCCSVVAVAVVVVVVSISVAASASATVMSAAIYYVDFGHVCSSCLVVVVLALAAVNVLTGRTLKAFGLWNGPTGKSFKG